MKQELSNQPRKGEIYYGVKLYDKNRKYIGSHNGKCKTKKVQYFVKDFFDMFIDELKEKAEKIEVKVEVCEKHF